MAEKVEVFFEGHDRVSGIAKGISGALKGLAIGGIAVAGAAFVGLGIGIASSVKEAMASENVMADLRAVLASTGGAAGVTEKMATDLAASLQKVTKFSDETTLAGESMLLTFTNIGKDIFPAATEAMLNLATKMKSDPTSAAIQLGKALNDPIRGVTALRRVGVAFTEDQLKQIKVLQESGDIMGAQKIILAELEKEFGGVAKAAGATFAGRLEILKNTFGELQEKIGFAVIPILQILLDKVLVPLIPLFERGAEKIVEFFGGIEKFVSLAGKGGTGSVLFRKALVGLFKSIPGGEALMSFFVSMSKWWADNGPGIVASAKELGAAVGQMLSQLAAKIGPFIGEVLNKFSTWFTENGPLIRQFIAAAVADFKRLAPVIVSLWDVVEPILGGIIDLVLSLAKLIMKVALRDWKGAWKAIQDIAKKAWSALSKALVAFLNSIAMLFGGSLEEIAKIWSDNWRQLQEILEKVWKIIISSIKGWLEDVARSISRALDDIKNFWQSAWNALIAILHAVWQAIVSYISAQINAVLSIIYGVLNSIYSIWQTIWNGIKQFLQAVWDGIVGVIRDRIDAAKALIQGFQDAWDRIKGVIQGLWDKIQAFWDWLTSLTLPAWLQNLMNFFGGGDTGALFRIEGQALSTANLMGGGMVRGVASTGGITNYHSYYGPVTFVLGPGGDMGAEEFLRGLK